MAISLDQAEQQADPDGQEPRRPRGWRRALDGLTRQRGPHTARNRWAVAALVAVALGAVFAPSSGTPTRTAAAESPDDGLTWAEATAAAVGVLSSGAPQGSLTLPAAPAQVADAAPPAPAAITGLAANGIPNVALNAYRVAAARMANASPSCGIDWSLLAGIGRVESDHGRFGGATLNSDGTSTPPIVGPALNGSQFAFIGDTDDGAYDGDATYDRAVGPMQFIPSTWRSYAIDADGVGGADPKNINDAALAAAHYLCVAGGDLRTDSGQRRAVMAYNHSDSYVAEVMALAAAYAAGIPVADLPLSGNTTGGIPAPSGDYAAPAAPGPAIGAADMTPASSDTIGQAAAPASGAPDGSGAPAPSPAVLPGTDPAPTGSGTSSGSTGSSSGGGSSGTAAGQSASAPEPAPQPSPAPAPLPLPLPLPDPAPVQLPAPPTLPLPPVQLPAPPTLPDPVTITCGLPLQPLCPTA